MLGPRNLRTGALAAALVTLLAVGAAACGDDDDDDTATPSDPTTTVAEETRPADREGDDGGAAGVTISGFTFSEASVAPGASVSVTNADQAPHTVTADEGDLFDVRLDAGGSGTFTAPDEPGTYPFHCEIHPSMKGELTVE